MVEPNTSGSDFTDFFTDPIFTGASKIGSRFSRSAPERKLCNSWSEFFETIGGPETVDRISVEGWCGRCELVKVFGKDFAGEDIIHTVLVPAELEQFPRGYEKCIEALASKTIETSDKCGSWISAIHKQESNGVDKSHIHHVHACQTLTSSHRECRCATGRMVQFPNFIRKRSAFRNVSPGHAEQLMLYLSENSKRYVYEASFGSRASYRSDNHEGDIIQLGCASCQETGDAGLLDASKQDWPGSTICNYLGEHTGQMAADEQRKGYKRRTTAAFDYVETGKEISASILKWQIKKEGDVINHLPDFEMDFPYLYWNPKLYNTVIPIAWDHAVKDWNKKTFDEILEIQWEHEYKFMLNFHPQYYAPEPSAYILARLILDQSNGIIEHAMEFVENVVKIIDKVNPKINTFLLVSPPSAGKTFLVNSIAGLLWNVGDIENAEKGGSAFTFQEAYNKRMAIWNECVLNGTKNIEASKQVWEGQSCAVQVKYKAGIELKRTPLFVTCNQRPWWNCKKNEQAFLDRCYFYEWTRQEWLKYLQLKPVPTAWMHLDGATYTWWDNIPSIDELLNTELETFKDYCYNKFPAEVAYLKDYCNY